MTRRHEDEILEVTAGELLREQTAEELDRRDGEWDAFTAGVFRSLDQEETATARCELEDQAVALLKQEVDAELFQMAPRFEEAFKESVEKRIFQSAIEPTIKGRLKRWLDKMRPEHGFGFGWAAAAAAAVALVVMVGPLDTERAPKIGPQLARGQVSVERISFDGDVTVLPEEGVTIIWLDSPAAS